jgi:hypothetical protein
MAIAISEEPLLPVPEVLVLSLLDEELPQATRLTDISAARLTDKNFFIIISSMRPRKRYPYCTKSSPFFQSAVS